METRPPASSPLGISMHEYNKSLFFVHGTHPVPIGTKPPPQSYTVWSPGPHPSCGTKESVGKPCPLSCALTEKVHVSPLFPALQSCHHPAYLQGTWKGKAILVAALCEFLQYHHCRRRACLGWDRKGFPLYVLDIQCLRGTSGQGGGSLASGMEAKAGHRRAQLL